MRLDKYLCDMKLGTRSQVKKVVKKGVVLVNDQVITTPEYTVDPMVDTVIYQGITIAYEEELYYLLHKPKGYVSATKDNVYPTVIELLEVPRKELLFPVGRLDVDTEGLLLLTSDGPLAHALLSPKKHVAKQYEAMIAGYVTEKEINQFREGIVLDDFQTKPATLTVEYYEGEQRTYVSVTIMEGKFHQIKRMFAAVGMEVLSLKRIAMGAMELPMDLPCGSYRKLTKQEVLGGLS